MISTGEFGLALRKARQRAGLTQAELAKRIGTSQSAVARAESGLVRPSLDFVERFVRETGETLQLGSMIVVPTGSAKNREVERTDRLHRAVGDFVFNPWARKPSQSEQKSLEADGLTREHFQREKPAR